MQRYKIKDLKMRERYDEIPYSMLKSSTSFVCGTGMPPLPGVSPYGMWPFIYLENNLTMPYTLELLYPYILLYFTLRVLFTGDAFDAVKTVREHEQCVRMLSSKSEPQSCRDRWSQLIRRVTAPSRP